MVYPKHKIKLPTTVSFLKKLIIRDLSGLSFPKILFPKILSKNISKITTAIIARDMQPLKFANKNLNSSANNEVTYFTTEPLNRTSKTGDENLNNFWDRVSHAKKNLDDFGSIRNGGNG